MSRHSRTLEFPLTPTNNTAAAVADALVAAIRDGRLADGDWLPSTRTLAGQLGCSRTLTVAAYDRLQAAGYLDGVPAAGTRVSHGAAQAARAGVRVALAHDSGGAGSGSTGNVTADPQHGTPAQRATVAAAGPVQPARPDTVVDLTPGHPDAGLVSGPAWRSAWRRAADTMADVEPWADDALPLAATLADHLRAGRGIAGARPQLLPGTRPAVRLLRQIVLGLSTAMESPGYGEMYSELGNGLGAGRPGGAVGDHAPALIPVDSDGIVVAALPDKPTLLHTTPAHQYPLGQRMSVPRRHDLVQWARATGSLIVEDDYDGEFRYGVAPLPALRAIPGAGDCVVYLGTASKILSPDLRVAWLDLPERLRGPVAQAAKEARLAVPSIVNRALADFITGGGLRSHLNRASRVYRQRRAVLLRALAQNCPDLVISGVDAGLHVTIELPGTDDREVASALADAGYRVAALTDYPAVRPQSGLVVGYARADHSQLRAFVAALKATIG